MYWTLELASKIEDAPWPATKDELLDYAQRIGAPMEVIENLQEIEDDEEIYECIEDLWPDYPTKVPRSIPDGFGAKIEKKAVKILPIFDLIAKTGNICERDMFNTFNMGVGMSVVVKKEDADKAIAILKSAGENAYVMGEVVKSDNKIEII